MMHLAHAPLPNCLKLENLHVDVFILELNSAHISPGTAVCHKLRNLKVVCEIRQSCSLISTEEKLHIKDSYYQKCYSVSSTRYNCYTYAFWEKQKGAWLKSFFFFSLSNQKKGQKWQFQFGNYLVSQSTYITGDYSFNSLVVCILWPGNPLK